MTIFHVIILSIVEGITEFLPISSTGHLILANRIMGIPETEFTKSFEIFIQLGAILAVLVLEAPKIWKRLRRHNGSTDQQKNTLNTIYNILSPILFAFLPTALIGFGLYKIVKQYFLGNSLITVISLFIGGIVILFLENMMQRPNGSTAQQKNTSNPNIRHTIYNIPPARAALIGLGQSISIIPGVSRSAASIFSGMAVGLTREQATEFSFLLAIPTMAAASGYDLLKSHASYTSQEILFLIIGFIGAFITAFITIKGLLQFVRTHNFKVFGYYRIILAIIFYTVFLR